MNNIIEFRIVLKGSRDPRIWRRFVIPDTFSLLDLHYVIQTIMGWEDSHLYAFIIENREYQRENTKKAKLKDLLLQEGLTFTYEYDFGDCWFHTLKIQKITPSKNDNFIPQVVSGKGACPPEDVGGIAGYYYFLESLHDPKHPEHENYLDWHGNDKFDPEKFDINTINQKLRNQHL